jgi:hypothetical protein
MSSLNIMIDLSNSYMNTKFTKYIKCVGALVSPNDITKYSYTPYPVENAVLRDVFRMVLDLTITQMKFYLRENLSTG